MKIALFFSDGTTKNITCRDEMIEREALNIHAKSRPLLRQFAEQKKAMAAIASCRGNFLAEVKTNYITSR